MKKETKAQADVIVEELVATEPPATDADAKESRALPSAAHPHLTVPSLSRSSILATPEAKALLSKHSVWLEAATGYKAADLTAHATATIQAGQRSQRIGESYNRSMDDYQAKLATSEVERTSVLKALKNLPDQSPVKKEFQTLLDRSAVAQGTAQGAKTKKKNEKAKAAKEASK